MSTKNEDTIRCQVSIEVDKDSNGNTVYDSFEDDLYQHQIDDYIERGYTVTVL
jgi:hypothetical protein